MELFAGAGGLALEIEKVGFNTVALVEIDKDAAERDWTNSEYYDII